MSSSGSVVNIARVWKNQPQTTNYQPENFVCAIGSINSHDFHIIGDGKLNPIVGVYIPIIRIPIKGGMTIPNIATFDHGTYETLTIKVF